MNGKHEFGCDCRDCMIFWAEDASSRALRTREFEPRLINNVESLVDHNNVQSWVDPNINQEGLDFIFGTRDAFNVPASGPSTIPPTIKVFIERIQNGSFATHAREDVHRFNELMKKYCLESYWIRHNLYARYVDNAEKLQKYLEYLHKGIKEQLARAVLARAGISEADLIIALSSDFTTSTAILTTPHIGRRIRKNFFGKWHSGIITSSDEEDLYHVKYDDGDSEDLDHDEMHKCLLSHEENESIAKTKKEAHAKCQQRSCLLSHEENDSIAKKKKEANAKCKQRSRDAKKVNVRTNTFVIIMIATCLILYIV